MSWLRTSLGAALVVALISSASSASGHERSTTTKVIFKVDAEVSEALVLYEVPAGFEASVLRTGYDRDKDGAFSPAEEKLLGDRLARDATAGLTVERDGEPLEAGDLEWRLEMGQSGDGAIAIALLIRFDAGGEGRYALASTIDRPAIALEIEAGECLRIGEASVLVADDGIGLGPVSLMEGTPTRASIVFGGCAGGQSQRTAD